MSKRVCHISTVHNENDSRIVLKEGQSLSKNGFETFYIVATDIEKELYGVKLIKLNDKSGSRIIRSIKRIKEAARLAKEIDADVYHFHDPELIPLGKKLKKSGKKVIYDVHEDIPKQILSKSYLGPLWLRKIISNIFNSYEKRAAKKFDAIFTATDEIAENFNTDRAVSIKNYALTEIIDRAIPVEREDDIITLTYVGSITEIRGIKEIIQAMNCLDGKAKLWILGTWESDELFEECKKLDGYKYAEYFGALPLKDVYKYTKAADIGVCTIHPTPNYIGSIPIKVMEYMASEKPLILSDFIYWKNLFGEIGLYVNPEEPKNIAEAIKYYINNKSEMIVKGKENRIKFEKSFSWDAEEIKLIDIYSKIIK